MYSMRVPEIVVRYYLQLYTRTRNFTVQISRYIILSDPARRARYAETIQLFLNSQLYDACHSIVIGTITGYSIAVQV